MSETVAAAASKSLREPKTHAKEDCKVFGPIRTWKRETNVLSLPLQSRKSTYNLVLGTCLMTLYLQTWITCEHSNPSSRHQHYITEIFTVEAEERNDIPPAVFVSTWYKTE